MGAQAKTKQAKYMARCRENTRGRGVVTKRAHKKVRSKRRSRAGRRKERTHIKMVVPVKKPAREKLHICDVLESVDDVPDDAFGLPTWHPSECTVHDMAPNARISPPLYTFTSQTKGSDRDVICGAIRARLVHDVERMDDLRINKVCGYLIKVSREITCIEVNRCKDIAKYVRTLDLTEECTGDIEKTYRGDCQHHDSRAQPYHSDSWRICVGSEGSELLSPIIVDVDGKPHRTVHAPDASEVEGGIESVHAPDASEVAGEIAAVHAADVSQVGGESAAVHAPGANEVAGEIEGASEDDVKVTVVELQKCDGLCKVRDDGAFKVREFCFLITQCVDENSNLGDMLRNLFAESCMSKSRNVDHMPYPCCKCEIFDSNLKWCLPMCKTGYSGNCTFDSACSSLWCNLYHMRPHSHVAFKLYANATAVKRACLARQALTDVLARECTLNDMYCMVAEVASLYPAGVWDGFTKGEYLDDAFKDIGVSRVGVSVQHDLQLDENAIITRHTEQYAAFEEKVCNVPIFPCISCHMLRRREEVVPFSIEDSDVCVGSVMDRLKNYVRENMHAEDALFICKLCKTYMSKESMPPSCVLNDLHLDPVPECLSRLNSFEKLLIQKVKPFQTCYKLDTKHGSRPYSERVRCAKNKILHLPLPIDANARLMHDLCADNINIIVNGVPTSAKIVWKHLVRPKVVVEALQWLSGVNPQYADVRNITTDEQLQARLGIAECADKVGDAESPLLVRMTHDEHLRMCEQYSMHALDFATTEDTSHYYRQERATGVPVDARDERTEYSAFPHLFPHGRFGKYHIRDRELSDANYHIQRLTNADSRFRRDQAYLFWTCNQHQLKAVSRGVQHMLPSRSACSSLTAGQLSNQSSYSNDAMDGEFFSVLNRVRGTQGYWHMHYRDLMSMVRTFGPPTWFVTFSAGEYEWEDMDFHLRTVNRDVEGQMTQGELCAQDPVTVARHFRIRQQAILDFLHKAQPLGRVEHHFVRLEYQARGAGHYHCLLWVKDAPVVGVNSGDEVREFITSRVTCQLPDPVCNPRLHEMVSKWQVHVCSGRSCRRTRYVSGEGKSVAVTRCRYGFPRKENQTFQLRDPTDARHANNRLYDVVRGSSESMVNDYNPELLLAWNGNMDVRFVADEARTVARYVTGYIAKAERSQLEDIAEAARQAHADPFRRAFYFGAQALAQREIGAYEAADLLLGTQLVVKSDVVKWVNTAFPHEMKRRLRPRAEIAELDNSSTDIYRDEWLTDYYPNRSDRMEGVSYHDFHAYYEYSSQAGPRKGGYETLRNEKGFVRKRAGSKVLNYRAWYPTRSEEQREKYYWTLLLLHVPFRDVAELKFERDSYADAFAEATASHPHLLELDAHAQRMAQLSDTAQEKEEANERRDNRLVLEDADAYAAEATGNVEVKVLDRMEDVELALRADPTESGEHTRESLTDEQCAVFDDIMKSLCSATGTAEKCNPLTLFVSGQGGCGKTFLIRTLRASCIEEFGEGSVALAAPTGLAAHGIGGVTIHRLLSLPVEHGSCGEYRTLSGEVRFELRTRLRNLKLLIIDEVSMVSNVTLLYIHLRLCEILGYGERSGKMFGGCNLVFFGDLLQLSPVKGLPVYCEVTHAQLKRVTGSATCMPLWGSFRYAELTKNVRQQGDNRFTELLNRVRVGEVTNEDFSCLQSRVMEGYVDDKWPMVVADFLIDMQRHGKLPTCLMATQAMCQSINEKMMGSFPLTFVIPCDDCVDSQSLRTPKEKDIERLQHLDHTRTGGLPQTLTLAVGCRVMLRRNVDVLKGLVNGSMGEVTQLDLGKGRVEKVHVLLDATNNVEVVEKVTVAFEVSKGVFYNRRQFPLVLAYSITIHKSQGLTLESVVTSLGPEIFTSGMAYVALSRCKTLEGIHILRLKRESITAEVKNVREYNRLRANFTPHLPPFPLPAEEPGAKKRKAQRQPGPKRSVRPTVAKVEGNENCRSPALTLRRPTSVAPVGLPNLGNTCFLNSALQLLASSQLSIHLSNVYGEQVHTDEPVIRPLVATLEALRMCQGAPPIRELLEDCRRAAPTMFDGSCQNVTEALMWLVETCDEYLRSKGADTMKSRMVIGYINTWHCECEQCPRNFAEGERELQIHNILLNGDTSEDAYRCLSHTRRHECSACGGNHDICRTSAMARARTGVCMEIFRGVREERAARFLLPTSFDIGDRNLSLVASVNHHGGLTGGHYTARVRRHGDVWNANDSVVSLNESIVDHTNVCLAYYE